MYVKKLERVMTCDVASVVTFLVAEITQVIDSIPWVRCASGNAFTVHDISKSKFK